MRAGIIGLYAITIIIIYLAPAYGMSNEEGYKIKESRNSVSIDKKSKTNQYIPGQLIIKLKEGKTLEDIKDLNAKYNVTAQHRVFEGISSPQDTLRELKDKLSYLTKEHQSWYWQLDKNSKEYKEYGVRLEKEKEELWNKIRKQEKLISKLDERQKRTPQGIAPPSLDNIYILNTDKSVDISQMAKEYSSNPNIEYAEPNYIMQVQALPNDTYVDPDQNGMWSTGAWGQPYEDMWGLKKIEADKAWLISQGEGVVVAVIDTGIDYNHEDIQDNIWINPGEIQDNGIDDDKNGYIDDVKGWDFIGADVYNPNTDNDPIDRHGHGTHVAGIVSAIGNNNKGIIGVAPKARVMILKGLDDAGRGDIYNLANCIKYATDNGADVLNNSWGSDRFYISKLLEDVVGYSYSKGCIIVVAAGNENGLAMQHTPSNIPYVITVAASDPYDKPCSFTNYGIGVDISAPGSDILSLRAEGTNFCGSENIVGEKYYRASGTSMACPYISGIAALILSRNITDSISWDNSRIQAAICDGSDKPESIMESYSYGVNDIYKAQKYGYGRSNAYEALLVDNSKPFPFIMLGSFIHLQSLKGVVTFDGSAQAEFPKRHLEFWWDYWRLPPQSNVNVNDYITQDSYNSISNGALFEFDTNKLKDGQYNLIPYIEDTVTGYQNIQWRSVYIANSEKEGFPFPLPEIISPPYLRRPMFYDLNGDRAQEIIINTENGILALKGNGAIYWRIEPDGQNILQYAPASIGDLDRDGSPEIVAIALTEVVPLYNDKFILRVFNSEGILETEKDLGDFCPYRCAPVLCDLDQNENLEIILAGTERYDFNAQIIKTFDSHGDLLHSITAVEDREGHNQSNFYPAAGNIDEAGGSEIVICTGLYYGPGEYQDVAMAFSNNGDLKWKTYLHNTSGPCYTPYVMLADVNNDGKTEVIITLNTHYRNECYICILKGENGEVVSSWPIYSTIDEPAILANLDQDKEPEIIYGSNGEVQAWNWDGTFVPGWESILLYPDQGDYSYRMSSVVAGDIDNDGLQEIIVGSASAIHIFNRSGTLLDKKSPGWLTRSYVGIADVDGDGKTELCGVNISDIFYGGFQGIHLWPIEGDGNYDAWPMFQHDAQHTGCYIRPNSTPKLNHIGDKMTNEGELLQFSISATDLDGDPLTYSASNLPEGATFDVANQVFRWTPNYNRAGTYNNIHFEVTDGFGGTDFEDIAIVVNDVNIPPVLDPIGNKIIERLKNFSMRVHATDPDGDSVTYGIINRPKGAFFNPHTGLFSWRPRIDQAGDFVVTFIAQDRYGNEDSETITITVRNTPPELYPIGDKVVYVGRWLIFRVKATDADKIDRPQLLYYADNLPRRARFVKFNGWFFWRPTSSWQRGRYRVRFYVKDPPGAMDEETITITVY